MTDKNILSSREIGIGCRMLVDCSNTVFLGNKGIRHDDLFSVRLMHTG